MESASREPVDFGLNVDGRASLGWGKVCVDGSNSFPSFIICELCIFPLSLSPTNEPCSVASMGVADEDALCDASAFDPLILNQDFLSDGRSLLVPLDELQCAAEEVGGDDKS